MPGRERCQKRQRLNQQQLGLYAIACHQGVLHSVPQQLLDELQRSQNEMTLNYQPPRVRDRQDSREPQFELPVLRPVARMLWNAGSVCNRSKGSAIIRGKRW